jgi:GntR family transcriptional regulator, arabinose operon transcriptional repressor
LVAANATNSTTTKYMVIKQQILQMIREGKYKVGDRLPSENELAAMYRVSVITSKKALEELAKDGCIYRIKGSGSYVADPRKKKKPEPAHRIAMVLPLGNNTGGGMELFSQVEMVARRHGYSVSVENTHRNCQKERDILRRLLKENVEGILYYPTFSSENFDLMMKFAMEKHPIVIIDKSIHDIAIDTVLSDNRRGSYLMTKHLIGCGHRSIIFACECDFDAVSSIRDRFLGYCDALSEANIPLDVDLVMHPNTIHEQCADRVRISHFCKEVAEKVQNDKSITAVQLASDVNAFELLGLCVKMGIKVPDDVSIAGFDDLDFASYLTPPLTTVKQSFGHIGQLATELIFKRIVDRDKKAEKVLIPVKLVIRQSCRSIDGATRKPGQTRHPSSSRSKRGGVARAHASTSDTREKAGIAADRRRRQPRHGASTAKKSAAGGAVS